MTATLAGGSGGHSLLCTAFLVLGAFLGGVAFAPLTSHPWEPAMPQIARASRRLMRPRSQAAGGSAAMPQAVTCTRAGAIAALSQGIFERLSEPKCNFSSPLIAVCLTNFGHQWAWGSPLCGQRRFNDSEIASLLQHMHLSAVGDSHARTAYWLFQRLLQGTLSRRAEEFIHFSSQSGIFGRNTSLSYHEQTRPTGVAETLRLMILNSSLPDVGIISTGAWYGLPKEGWNVTELPEHMKALEEALQEAHQARPNTLWLLMTVPQRAFGRNNVGTWHVNVSLTPHINSVIRSSRALHPHGPALLLDAEAMSSPCMPWCSIDAAHLNSLVYSIFAQVIANLLPLP